MKKGISILFFSLFFAVAVWLYLTLNLNYTINISLPVEVRLSEGQAVSGDLPGEIDATIRGKGWDLILIMLSKNIGYTLDLSGLKKDTKLNSLGNISEKIDFPANVSVIKLDPDTLDIRFDNIVEKYVKFKNNLKVISKEGYRIVGTPEFYPDSVKISGANSVLSKIKQLGTESETFDNVKARLIKTVKIVNSLGNLVKIDPDVVRVEYGIELSAEKAFTDIEIKLNNVPGDKEVLLIPPRITVSLRGGVDQLAKLLPGEITAFAEYSEIDKDTNSYIIPKIELPFEAEIISIEPQKVQYIIKKK